MRTLGEDIVLLAVKPDGHISVWDKLRFALAGSELIRLTAARKVEIVDKRIMVMNTGSVDDPLLAAALDDIERSKRPPRATDWVTRHGQQRLVDQYLARLTDAAVLRAERRKALGVFTVKRWYVVDSGRQADARSRLDEIAHNSGPVDSTQAAFGGLVRAIQLDRALYPGSEGKPARKRLEELTRRDAVANTVRYAAADASTHAATDTAIRAATQASTDAAIQASIQASIDAAVSASATATHNAGHAGATGGHH